jgi:co-chaperonin GroES (HSP10)
MIEAVGDKVLVKLLRREQTQGGIVLPGNSADPQGYGEVLSVGPEVPTYKDTPEKNIKEGDVLVFHTHAGKDLVMEGEILRIVTIFDVYGILTNEDFIANLSEMTLAGSSEGTPLIQPLSGMRQTAAGGEIIAP